MMIGDGDLIYLVPQAIWNGGSLLAKCRSKIFCQHQIISLYAKIPLFECVRIFRCICGAAVQADIFKWRTGQSPRRDLQWYMAEKVLIGRSLSAFVIKVD